MTHTTRLSELLKRGWTCTDDFIRPACENPKPNKPTVSHSSVEISGTIRGVPQVALLSVECGLVMVQRGEDYRFEEFIALLDGKPEAEKALPGRGRFLGMRNRIPDMSGKPMNLFPEIDEPAPVFSALVDEKLSGTGKPYLVPMTLAKANDFVALHHRHNGRTSRNGGKWSCGVAVDGVLVGVAIVGNPLSATLMDGWTAEVLRDCVLETAPKGCCSMLYAACWRAWVAMGGRRMITYNLKSESGASLNGLKQLGWKIVGETKPVKDGWRKDDHLNGNRTHTPVMLEVKNRWEVCKA